MNSSAHKENKSMRLPSITTLKRLTDGDGEKAHAIRMELARCKERAQSEDYGSPPPTEAAEMALEQIDCILGTHGVEYILSTNGTGAIYYCNTGDTYGRTLLYDTRSQVFSVGSWGNVVERQEARFRDR
jgi:hypothetical protein